MHKYTLQFKTKELEDEYQAARLSDIQYPMLVWLSMIGIFYNIYFVVDALLMEQIEACILNICLVAYQLVTLIIGLKFNEWIKNLLILTSYLAVLQQFDQENYAPSSYYIAGSNVTLFSACLLVASDFRHAIHQSIFYTTGKVMITYFQCSCSDYRNYIGSYCIILVVLQLIYRNEKYARTSFLMAKKDQLWVNYLPAIIRNPYYYFTYDAERMEFKVIREFQTDQYQDNLDKNLAMRKFFRICKYQNQSLEKFIFHKFVLGRPLKSNIEVKYGQQRLKITLCNFESTNDQYLLIIEQVRQGLDPKELLMCKFIKTYGNYFKKINLNNKLPQTPIIQQTFLSALLVRSEVIRRMDLSSLVKQFCTQYSRALNMHITLQKQEQCYIRTYSDMVFAYLTFVFNMFDKFDKIEISVTRFQDFVQIKINSKKPNLLIQKYESQRTLKQLEQEILFQKNNLINKYRNYRIKNWSYNLEGRLYRRRVRKDNQLRKRRLRNRKQRTQMQLISFGRVYEILIIKNIHLMDSCTYMFKFVINGSSEVGKSSLLSQFIDHNFDLEYNRTIGVEFGNKIMKISQKNIMLQIWDTAGLETFRSIIPSYYRNAVCALIVYDVTSRSSFDYSSRRIAEIRSYSHKQIILVLVANKIDLPNRVIATEEGLHLAQENDLLFFETSAKTGFNIDEIFKLTCDHICQKIEIGEIDVNDEVMGIRRQPIKDNNFQAQQSQRCF